MSRSPALRALALIVLASALRADPPPARWPQFRGPDAAGVADGQDLPLEWDAASGKNIVWKRRVPGLGHASPVVWDDQVFIATALSGKEDPELRVGLYGDIASVDDPTEHAWLLVSIERRSGDELWRREVERGVPAIRRHTKATHANSTPATDGERVVLFLGSEGLFCYDMKGELAWRKDLGRLDAGFYRVPSAQWGFGSSPVIHEGKVYVQCDVQEGSFVAAFDARSGDELWRTPRDDVPSWSTPLVLRDGERRRLVVNGYRHMGAYELATGKEAWRLGGGGDIPVPAPIFAARLIFFTSAHGPASPIIAVRPGGSGDLSLGAAETRSDAVAWSIGRGGNYMQTPIVYGDRLYACRDNGVLSCFVAATGELVYRERLGKGTSGFTASPVAADGKLYFASEDGDIHVVAAGAEHRVLATNAMGEVCMATPALAGGLLIVRGRDHVFAIGTAAKAPPPGER